MPRRNDIDFIKGIAIIAIVFYHIGILPYGYLGVDIFFVIAGYFSFPKLFADDFKGVSPSPIVWFRNRFTRFLPITLILCIVALFVGYFVMMPDDFENLSEGVVATDLFANNILAILTTKNYWDVANEYKPLMQTWYLGVLVQLYFIIVVFALIQTILKRYHVKNRRNIIWWVIAVGALASLMFFILVDTDYKIKYYLPQYRFWEFAMGGLIGWYGDSKVIKRKGEMRWMWWSVLSIVILLLCWNPQSLSGLRAVYIQGMERASDDDTYIKMAVCVITVCLSCVLLLQRVAISQRNIFSQIGAISLSVFLWHQLILAFTRYVYTDNFSWIGLCGLLLIIAIVSVISSKTLEKIKIRTSKALLLTLVAWTAVTATGLTIYQRRGVVRDVPELGIKANDPSTYGNIEYVDRIYAYSIPFKTDRKHVLVIGNSYGRDFASILMEYDTERRLEIAYSFYGHISSEDLRTIDYIFIFGERALLDTLVPKGEQVTVPVYGISTKYFGKNLGLTYSNRGTEGYYNQAIPRNEVCDSVNDAWRQTFPPGHFIDMMELIIDDNNNIPLFTPDSMFISFDCRHLTQAGCRYYAKIIDFDNIFGFKSDKVAEKQ